LPAKRIGNYTDARLFLASNSATRGAGFLRQYALVVLVGLPAPLTRKPRQARKGAAAAGAWATGSGGRGPPLFYFPVRYSVLFPRSIFRLLRASPPLRPACIYV